MSVPRPDSDDTVRLLRRVEAGDPPALPALLARHRAEIRAYVEFRFDPALRGRLDPSDVVQESQMEISRRLPDFLARRPMPYHVWVRKTARERYLNLREFHLAHRRDIRREEDPPDPSTIILADRLVAAGPCPAQAADARERAGLLTGALGRLADDDREVLLMRIVEQLPHAEISCLIGISEDAVRQRYGRALARLAEAAAAFGPSGGP